MNKRIRLLVRNRANHRCEYCLLHETHLPLFPFHLEHIIPSKHGGTTRLSNLCWSCLYCNLAKGSNLSGIDPYTGQITPLFHPRKKQWRRHFQLHGATLVGRTATGRATVAVMRMNVPHRVALRARLIQLGLYP